MILIILGLLSHNSANHNFCCRLAHYATNFFITVYSLDRSIWFKTGNYVLTLGVLSPLVSGKIPLPELSAFIHWKMFSSIGVGIFVAWLAGQGVDLMTNQPVLVTGLMIGTVIGVSFFGGIPVGPLIAAGILALLLGKI